jgi:hypothetical protein
MDMPPDRPEEPDFRRQEAEFCILVLLVVFALMAVGMWWALGHWKPTR